MSTAVFQSVQAMPHQGLGSGYAIPAAPPLRVLQQPVVLQSRAQDSAYYMPAGLPGTAVPAVVRSLPPTTVQSFALAPSKSGDLVPLSSPSQSGAVGPVLPVQQHPGPLVTTVHHHHFIPVPVAPGQPVPQPTTQSHVVTPVPQPSASPVSLVRSASPVISSFGSRSPMTPTHSISYGSLSAAAPAALVASPALTARSWLPQGMHSGMSSTPSLKYAGSSMHSMSLGGSITARSLTGSLSHYGLSASYPARDDNSPSAARGGSVRSFTMSGASLPCGAYRNLMPEGIQSDSALPGGSSFMSAPGDLSWDTRSEVKDIGGSLSPFDEPDLPARQPVGAGTLDAVREVVTAAGQKLGRPPHEMERLLRRLQENGVVSRLHLARMDEQSAHELKIPLRLFRALQLQLRLGRSDSPKPAGGSTSMDSTRSSMREGLRSLGSMSEQTSPSSFGQQAQKPRPLQRSATTMTSIGTGTYSMPMARSRQYQAAILQHAKTSPALERKDTTWSLPDKTTEAAEKHLQRQSRGRDLKFQDLHVMRISNSRPEMWDDPWRDTSSFSRSKGAVIPQAGIGERSGSVNRARGETPRATSPLRETGSTSTNFTRYHAFGNRSLPGHLISRTRSDLTSGGASMALSSRTSNAGPSDPQEGTDLEYFTPWIQKKDDRRVTILSTMDKEEQELASNSQELPARC